MLKRNLLIYAKNILLNQLYSLMIASIALWLSIGIATNFNPVTKA
ncbi:hypothetical protein [Dendronalium sp. ChiSLP03b]|nr:hypothetical protein [Dendronalium sp. ChiSLP03b]MDZ8204270.1 hypothetical protein [Dendronalium sp. ChiSLP03b]